MCIEREREREEGRRWEREGIMMNSGESVSTAHLPALMLKIHNKSCIFDQGSCCLLSSLAGGTELGRHTTVPAC